jgi:biotin synthase
MECLGTLKELGFQTGCGMMVQSPHQSLENLAADLEFISSFQPHMCGIGPFIPHKDTPLAKYSAGSVDLTVFLLALVRLSVPKVLLPATTAVATLDPKGRTKAVLAGANVVMPNLSPESVKDKYSLYNNKLSRLGESALGISKLREEFSAIDRRIAFERGDWKQ